MSKQSVLIFQFLIFSLSINAQNVTYENVTIGINAPDYGVKIKTNFPGYNGSWARAYFVSNENGSKDFFTFGSYGTSVNGVSSVTRNFIGRNLDTPYMTFLPNGYVGIGTTVPTSKLTVAGSHTDSSIWLHSTGEGSTPSLEADLSLWASEPGASYDGVGIANNITNYSNGKAFNRISTTRGGSYIRLLNNAMSFNLVSVDGIDITTIKLNSNGNVGIGTINPDSKLTVNGTIHATEVKVTQSVPADYVFEKYYLGESSLKPDYTLLTLSEVEKFTETNHHLPNVPSAKEIKENGLLLGEMSNVLLQKIEELTLYVIEQNKKQALLEKEIAELKKIHLDLKK